MGWIDQAAVVIEQLAKERDDLSLIVRQREPKKDKSGGFAGRANCRYIKMGDPKLTAIAILETLNGPRELWSWPSGNMRLVRCGFKSRAAECLGLFDDGATLADIVDAIT